MHLEPTADQRELRDSVRDVLGRESPPSVARALAEHGTAPDALWRTQTQLGWLDVAAPESCVELMLVCEELGRHLAVGPFLATAQALCLAPDCVTGERTATVVLTADYVTDAASADVFVVVTETGVAVVDRAGVATAPVRSVDGTRPFGSVRTDGLDTGTPGDTGHGVAAATVAQAAEMVGLAQSLLDLVVEHAKTRVQFGVPIGTFQAVKHACADMHVLVERARATTYAASAAVAENADERDHYVSAAKAAAGDMEQVVAENGIQLLGGVGYTWEHDAHLYAKRLKSAAPLFGTAREHRARLATHLLG